MADEATGAARVWAELRPFFGWIGAILMAAAGAVAGSLVTKKRDDRRAAAETKKDEAEAATIETNRDITVGGAWKQYALDQVEILEGRVEAQGGEIAALQGQLVAAQAQLAAAQALTAEMGAQFTESLTKLASALAANLVLTERNHRLEVEIANLRKALGDVPAAT